MYISCGQERCDCLYPGCTCSIKDRLKFNRLHHVPIDGYFLSWGSVLSCNRLCFSPDLVTLPCRMKYRRPFDGKTFHATERKGEKFNFATSKVIYIFRMSGFIFLCDRNLKCSNCSVKSRPLTSRKFETYCIVPRDNIILKITTRNCNFGTKLYISLEMSFVLPKNYSKNKKYLITMNINCTNIYVFLRYTEKVSFKWENIYLPRIVVSHESYK